MFSKIIWFCQGSGFKVISTRDPPIQIEMTTNQSLSLFKMATNQSLSKLVRIPFEMTPNQSLSLWLVSFLFVIFLYKQNSARFRKIEEQIRKEQAEAKKIVKNKQMLREQELAKKNHKVTEQRLMFRLRLKELEGFTNDTMMELVKQYGITTPGKPNKEMMVKFVMLSELQDRCCLECRCP